MFQSVKERTDYTTKAKAMIKKYGKQNIKHMRIHRQPLSSFMLAALNLLTLGDFKKRFRNSPYDTLFHLRVDLYMENGKVISAEKNDVITFTERPSTTSTAQRMDVPLSTPVTLNDLLENTQKLMGNKYFYYSAKSNNCGDWILAMFRSNGLLTSERETFIKQNVNELFTDYSRKLTNTVTDIAGAANTLKGGQIKSNDEYIMIDTKELTDDVMKLVEKHAKKAIGMKGGAIDVASEVEKPAKKTGRPEKGSAEAKAWGEKMKQARLNKRIGGDGGKPPTPASKMKGAGRRKVKDYIDNPFLLSLDGGIAAGEFGRRKLRGESKSEARQVGKQVKDKLEPGIKKAGKYTSPIQLAEMLI